jgi:hypothetical protein
MYGISFILLVHGIDKHDLTELLTIHDKLLARKLIQSYCKPANYVKSPINWQGIIFFYFAVCCIFAIFAANYNHHEYNYRKKT